MPLILPATTNSCGYRRMHNFRQIPDSNPHKIPAEQFQFIYQHKLVMPDSEGIVAAPLLVAEIFITMERPVETRNRLEEEATSDIIQICESN